MPKRYVVLPERGTLLVNTDIHGNLEDFERLSRGFFTEGQRQLCLCIFGAPRLRDGFEIRRLYD